jgi:hypothetical protein
MYATKCSHVGRDLRDMIEGEFWASLKARDNAVVLLYDLVTRDSILIAP